MVITRSVTIDPAKTPPHIYISWDLLQRSFHPAGNRYLPSHTNTGDSLPTWLEKRKAGSPAVRFATNTLHTNFVRGNGFIVLGFRLIHKPPQAIPLDGDNAQPLDGSYTTLVLSPGHPRIQRLNICQNKLCDISPPEIAISGPQIVCNGHNSSQQIPVRLPAQGPTQGDEINYPREVRTSFTAFGITAHQHLLIASAFAGCPQVDPLQAGVTIFQPEPGDGLNLYEMAELMIELGAQDAMIGGGSGDTQQYIAGQGAWCALPRPQPGRPQANAPYSIRGLGAILWI